MRPMWVAGRLAILVDLCDSKSTKHRYSYSGNGMHPNRASALAAASSRGFQAKKRTFPEAKRPGDYPSPSIWWRRRESNPRPQDLDHRIYMRSLSFVFDTPGLRRTGSPGCEPACFNARSAGRPSAIPRLSTPRRPFGHRVRGRTRAEGSLLKQRGRNCCRWQL